MSHQMIIKENAPAPTVVYSVDAYNYTGQKVAQEFAANFFQEPRTIAGKIKPDGTFKLVDGSATYQIKLVKGIQFESVDTFQVIRL